MEGGGRAPARPEGACVGFVWRVATGHEDIFWGGGGALGLGWGRVGRGGGGYALGLRSLAPKDSPRFEVAGFGYPTAAGGTYGS